MVLCGLLLIACKKRAYNSSDAGASSATGLGKGLDVNDVSFLFPSPKDKSDFDSLVGFGTMAVDMPVFPRNLFDAMLKLSEAEGDLSLFQSNGASYEHWRVVGARVDPCADNKAKRTIQSRANFIAAGCKVQMRLIAQSFTPVTTQGRTAYLPDDQAIHLSFNLSGEDLFSTAQKMAQDLSTLKDVGARRGIDTSYSVLGPHPALKDSALKSNPFFEALRGYILRHATFENLFRASTMFTTVGAGATRWNFFTVNLDKANLGQPVKGMVPLFDGAKVQTLNDFFRPVESQMHPEKSVLSLEKALHAVGTAIGSGPNVKIGDIKNALAGVTQADLEKVQSIVDPTRTTILQMTEKGPSLGTDCVSCHRATPSLHEYAGMQEALKRHPNDFAKATSPIPGADLSDAFGKRFVSPAGITWYADGAYLSKRVWDVRNFGYINFQEKPVVTLSRATINESAIVADLFNRVFLNAANPSPVGASCNVPELEKCIYYSGGKPCFAKAKCQ